MAQEIYELINLRELFLEIDLPSKLKELETSAKVSLYINDESIKREAINLIKSRFSPIRKIFTGDNQIMAEAYFIEKGSRVMKNAYICDVPKEHQGKYAEVLIKSYFIS